MTRIRNGQRQGQKHIPPSRCGMTSKRCGMRQRSIQFWTAKLLLIAAAVALPAEVLAQDEQDGPRQGGVTFAGGQMVQGTVTATAADHLTVKTEAGEVYQVALSANTRLTKERQPVKVADIKVGDAVGAMGVLDAPTKTVHAVFVGVIDAEQVKKARENMGKTYITGKVTAIDMDALKLTVMRPDGVSQVIGVDEQTSFKRGGRGMAAIANGGDVVEMGGGGGGGGGEDEGWVLALELVPGLGPLLDRGRVPGPGQEQEMVAGERVLPSP